MRPPTAKCRSRDPRWLGPPRANGLAVLTFFRPKPRRDHPSASNADEAAARCAVTVFLAEINSEKVQMSSRSLTVAPLRDQFATSSETLDNEWQPQFCLLTASGQLWYFYKTMSVASVPMQRPGPAANIPEELIGSSIIFARICIAQ